MAQESSSRSVGIHFSIYFTIILILLVFMLAAWVFFDKILLQVVGLIALLTALAVVTSLYFQKRRLTWKLNSTKREIASLQESYNTRKEQVGSILEELKAVGSRQAQAKKMLKKQEEAISRQDIQLQATQKEHLLLEQKVASLQQNEKRIEGKNQTMHNYLKVKSKELQRLTKSCQKMEKKLMTLQEKKMMIPEKKTASTKDVRSVFSSITKPSFMFRKKEGPDQIPKLPKTEVKETKIETKIVEKSPKRNFKELFQRKKKETVAALPVLVMDVSPLAGQLQVQFPEFPLKNKQQRVQLQRLAARFIQDQEQSFSISKVLSLLTQAYENADQMRDTLSVEIKSWVDSDPYVIRTAKAGGANHYKIT